MYRSIKHLNYIRKKACLISQQYESQACHIRILSDGGTGLKPSDYCVLPFNYYYHKMQTDIGELTFYKKFNINPYEFAIFYAINSPCKKITKEHIEYLKERKSVYERLHQNR
tara:strand:- start:468 stop:803 length:336 start_codon:yes stop_codon:yes gene_type:complete